MRVFQAIQSVSNRSHLPPAALSSPVALSAAGCGPFNSDAARCRRTIGIDNEDHPYCGIVLRRHLFFLPFQSPGKISDGHWRPSMGCRIRGTSSGLLNRSGRGRPSRIQIATVTSSAQTPPCLQVSCSLDSLYQFWVHSSFSPADCRSVLSLSPFRAGTRSE
jgi:hypothetical protein